MTPDALLRATGGTDQVICVMEQVGCRPVVLAVPCIKADGSTHVLSTAAGMLLNHQYEAEAQRAQHLVAGSCIVLAVACKVCMELSVCKVPTSAFTSGGQQVMESVRGGY